MIVGTPYLTYCENKAIFEIRKIRGFVLHVFLHINNIFVLCLHCCAAHCSQQRHCDRRDNRFVIGAYRRYAISVIAS